MTAQLDGRDLATLAAALGRRLRDVGLPVTHERSARFARATALVAPRTRTELYWTARTVFVSSEAQLSDFDRVFAAVFDPRLEPDEERGDPHSPPLGSRVEQRPPGRRSRSPRRDAPGADGTGIAPTATSGGDREREIEVPLALASDEERLGHKSFDALEPEELAQLRRLMAQLELATPRRRKRRARQAPSGERLDLRRVLRASLRTGGEPLGLVRRRRRAGPRRLVLGGRTPQAALQRAAAAAPDWSSGTRIGQALKAFNDRYGRRGMARGAVVVILSDGWERADPTLLGREMERLARLAHRIVWVNPRAGAPGFEPRAGGMAAALPYCDAVISGHNLRAMDALVEAIASSEVASAEAARPSPATDREQEPSWPSAEPTEAQRPVPMPSGYGPKRGRTTP